MTEDNKIINALWIGKTLSLIELLTLNSFTFHGHIIHLWTYGEIETTVPPGVVFKNANLIIPESSIIIRKYKDPVTGVGKGSVGAPFSDLFRYKLLYELGGWWVDMDVTCLKPLDINDPYFFRGHLILNIIGNVMKCPRGSELMYKTYQEVKNSCDENTLDWLLPNKILNRNINELGLTKYTHNDISNKDDWNETKKYIRKNLKIPQNWILLHWSNEEWRMNSLDKQNIRLSNSTLGTLIIEYNVPHGNPKILNLLSNEIKLILPFSGLIKIKWFMVKIYRYFYWYIDHYIKGNYMKSNR